MEMIGISHSEVVTIFMRYFKELALEDSLINSVAMAVGEVVEENNKRLLEDLKAKNYYKKEG